MVKSVSKKKNTSSFSKDRIKNAKSRMRGSSKEHKAKKDTAHYPQVAEPALVHPWNHSLVKIRENGTIDAFAEGDNGIRINPNDKTIDMFTSTVRHHTKFIRSFVSRDVVQKVKGYYIIECGSVKITAKKSIEINAGKDINVNAGGNMNFHAGGKYYFN